MAENEVDDARRQLLRALLDKVTTDDYPSSTILDFVEELLTPQDVPAYAGALLQHIRSDTYPSTSMIERLVNLTAP